MSKSAVLLAAEYFHQACRERSLETRVHRFDAAISTDRVTLRMDAALLTRPDVHERSTVEVRLPEGRTYYLDRDVQAKKMLRMACVDLAQWFAHRCNPHPRYQQRSVEDVQSLMTELQKNKEPT